MAKIGFDNEQYLKLQSEQIKKRISQFGGKLYLEFGGKLFDDYHASRVLPGFEPSSKIQMLRTLKDQVEIVIVISANDIQKNKIRGDLGISYDEDVLRLMDIFASMDLFVGSVVITHYAGQTAAQTFLKRLTALGIHCYCHYPIEGYPSDVAHIISEDGFGRNDYIQTSRSLVVVTAPGPGSGKMATCLSQIYHDHKRGIQAGYAKFETFPIWNLPLKHPVNLAYEAATADLNDVNMIDPYHLEAYGQTTVNYNRDVEIFPVLKAMFKRILGEVPYKSPTDMGVNMAGYCIVDDDVARAASRREILRRYYAAQVDRVRGSGTSETVRKIELLLEEADITTDITPCIGAARRRAEETGMPAAAMQLEDGSVVTGKTSPLMGAASSMLLNALKKLGGIDKETQLISPEVLKPVCQLKSENLGHKNPRLHSDEVLMCLCMSAVSDPVADLARQQLPKLAGSEAHFSVIISPVDEHIYRRLGIHISCEPRYETQRLYHK
ncbi:MAG: DUF1846 domain-containing protein [Christensenellaceae bacterium]|nr:DUF1846 domain-containing protein [Christensenellaceae bacterium]